MSQILFIGLDVDDYAFNGCAFFKESGEVIEFKTRPHIDGLSKKLAEIKGKYPDFEMLLLHKGRILHLNQVGL